MSEQATPDFNAALQRITHIMENDEFDLCAQASRELLLHSALPNYHRMSILLILANVTKEWAEAEVSLLVRSCATGLAKARRDESCLALIFRAAMIWRL